MKDPLNEFIWTVIIAILAFIIAMAWIQTWPR